MRKFDTKVQHLKYKVLREVARHAWAGDLTEHLLDLPQQIIPGKEPTMRCCVYKERAILAERIKIAMGSSRTGGNIIEVIDIACDECPAGGYDVTELCRGCLAHRCEDVCPKKAITFDTYQSDPHQRAHIDKNLCVNCGKCAQVCPYSAIMNRKRPCENACKIHAISMAEDGSAQIDRSVCTSCGACVYQCPFGAISDRSFILDVVELLKTGAGNNGTHVYAVVAPSISSQFAYAKTGQVVSGMKKLGFYSVVEAALGADMVAQEEAAALAEAGFLTSSCCPAFVTYIETQFPSLAGKISESLSPMATISRVIKETDPGSAVVFIGPCTAKKTEFQKDTVREWVDSVITFEELQALFDSRDIELTDLPETPLDNASYYGRIFARSGGLTEAVSEALKESGSDFKLLPVTCDGIDACRVALLKASHGKADFNFIEGMACTGGCIGGAGCLTHGERNRAEVDRYGMQAYEKTIRDAVSVLKLGKKA